MKAYWTLPFLAFFIASCIGIETESSIENTNPLEAVDTIIIEEVEEETPNTSQHFELIEDYAQITTKTELYETFPAENLEDEEAWYAEGTIQLQTTWLTNPENGHKVKYVWSEENEEDLESIEFHLNIYDDYELTGTQEIHSEYGVYTGMSLEELVEWNGESFEFSGFGWDYAGSIMPSEGSRIANSSLGLQLDIEYTEENTTKYHALIGDVLFSTDSPEVKGAPIKLFSITYWMAKSE